MHRPIWIDTSPECDGSCRYVRFTNLRFFTQFIESGEESRRVNFAFVRNVAPSTREVWVMRD